MTPIILTVETVKELTDKHEEAHFAHAAGRVLRALTAKQAAKCGQDLIELVGREAPVSALGKIACEDKPTRAEIRAVADQLMRKKVRPTPFDRILGWTGDIFGLDRDERIIFSVMGRWRKFSGWRDLVRHAPENCDNLSVAMLAQLSGLSPEVIEQKLMPGSDLISSRLIGDDRDGEYSAGGLLKHLIRVKLTSREALVSWLMPKPEQSNLQWDDFAHLGALRDVAEKMLASDEPVSILLYGDPGTGKTEFARLLSSQVGRGATFAGLTDDSGNEPERSERLDHLAMLRVMTRHERSRVIVVDEADDVLVFSGAKGASKQWLNRLVEDPQTSTIWIVNSQQRLDPAILRRMALVIAFDQPKRAVREKIVQRAASHHAITLNATELSKLASLKTYPAVVASGMRAARLVQGGADLAQTVIYGTMRALEQSLTPEIYSPAVYTPSLSRADVDLERLAERLTASTDKGWSLLLSGPSGTGKSAFARHLAERMGLEIEQRRCSDLMSPFVGETEQNIAEAFAVAAERNALLLIDEADSFLYARDSGQRSWEISQVNEMLVQMEHLRTPFVATTNLADRLDPASQRRFTLRVAFQAMTKSQILQLFRVNFGQAWPQQVPTCDGQTPGDFAVVARRAELLGENDPAVLARWLREEIEARGEQQKGAIGFCLPGALPNGDEGDNLWRRAS